MKLTRPEICVWAAQISLRCFLLWHRLLSGFSSSVTCPWWSASNTQYLHTPVLVCCFFFFPEATANLLLDLPLPSQVLLLLFTVRAFFSSSGLMSDQGTCRVYLLTASSLISAPSLLWKNQYCHIVRIWYQSIRSRDICGLTYVQLNAECVLSRLMFLLEWDLRHASSAN